MARLAVDIGGTFTDIALELGDGRLETSKVPTTPRSPEKGVMDGVMLALDQAGISAGDVTSVIHGTTLATNALIERKGATTALICTDGFRDTLRLAYENRYDQYELWLDKPEPIVPRFLTYPVVERLDVRGQVLRPLDESMVAPIAVALKAEGVEAVAIGLLHAYANPDHERRVRDLLLAEQPDLLVTLSSEVCPEMREYERLTTATCNAYVQPLMARYLRALDRELQAAGVGGPMLMMTSGGGVCALETAIRFPIRLVESGPSGGAILAASVAAERGEHEVLSYDMGGTTAKICLIDDATPQTARTFEIARAARFTKGSGLPVR
ncbi:MAG: hydantoinase/oxoprolinase family protein, partial [Alphaproteobacteria bacterium]|nr:hydantoinase/oxoprolinase family protein [Alphaproteobacteria bacterium]